MPAATLRVLLVAQPTTGGTARCVQQLVEAAVEHELDVRVVCPANGPLAESVVAAGAAWTELDMRRSPTPRDAAHALTLRRLAKTVDVIHLHSSKAGAVGRLALRSMGHRRPGCAFTPHGWSWQSGGPLASAYRAFERRTAHLADAIIAVSDEERDAGLGVLGSGATIEVIENGVDTRHFTPSGEQASRDTAPLIVCVGRLAFPKGQDVAIRALASMRDRTARLRLVGDGPDRPSLRALAVELGVDDRIELIGEAADVRPHLRAADVVVVPSHSEGQSLGMLEAMACERVVVTTSVSGSSAVAGVGVIVPVRDPEAMSHALDELVADSDRRVTLGQRARAQAETRFNIGLVTARNIAVWRRIARPRATTSPC